MLIQVEGSREQAVHALINTWLKIESRWCLNCHTDADSANFPCCESPYWTTNQVVFKRFMEAIKEIRVAQNNEFASTDGKNMRYVLKFPPTLYEFLDTAFKRLYKNDDYPDGEPLFTKKHNHRWFAKKFGKYFAVPEKV